MTKFKKNHYNSTLATWFIGKDPNGGKDWMREEKGTTEDEVVGWHHWCDGHESEQTRGVAAVRGVTESDWATELNDEISLHTHWMNKWIDMWTQLDSRAIGVGVMEPNKWAWSGRESWPCHRRTRGQAIWAACLEHRLEGELGQVRRGEWLLTFQVNYPPEGPDLGVRYGLQVPLGQFLNYSPFLSPLLDHLNPNWET